MILHEKQKVIVKSKARFKVIRAGRRFGKTLVETEIMLFKAISKTISKAMEGKDRNVLFIAPTQKQARSIVWGAFRARLEDTGEFNEARLEIRLPTEDGQFSTIYIGGWENRENYRGMPNVYHITFDEVDTMKEFFVSWQEIFRPMLIDTQGTADFIGTPKKENPNLRRLEKDFSDRGEDFEAFHFKTEDNPFIAPEEILKAKNEMDYTTFRQEILAEYVENQGSLMKYNAICDVFTNTIVKTTDKYLIVDIADDGSDKTVFSYWEGLEEVWRERYERLNTELIIGKIREFASLYQIPFSHIAVDAIGVGAGVASSSLLDGIIGFKSSYAPIKTDMPITRIPGVGQINSPLLPKVSDYKNLRSQCVFTLADHINNHKIASKASGSDKDRIIEELYTYQDITSGDGKRQAMAKEQIKDIIGRSPDDSDTWIMRMYFVIMNRMIPGQSEQKTFAVRQQNERFESVRSSIINNGTR